MKLRYLPIEDVHPFDRTHWQTDDPPGFATKDKVPGEHMDGVLHVKRLVEAGVVIAPIAVCPMSLVPADRPRSDAPFQRLDGFKRYMGQRLAGVTEILCEVHDEYRPGCQKGGPLSLEVEALGKVVHQLYSGEYDPKAWPWQGRISIEDCETIHVHLGHLRLEFNREQFLELADNIRTAAETLRKRRGL